MHTNESRVAEEAAELRHQLVDQKRGHGGVPLRIVKRSSHTERTIATRTCTMALLFLMGLKAASLRLAPAHTTGTIRFSEAPACSASSSCARQQLQQQQRQARTLAPPPTHLAQQHRVGLFAAQLRLHEVRTAHAETLAR